MLKVICIWGLAGLVLFSSVVATLRNRWNAGIFLVWCVGIALVFYGLFHAQVDAFTSFGIGYVLKILFFLFCAVYVVLMLFLGIAGHTHKARGDEAIAIVLGAGLKKRKVSDLLRRRLQAARDAYAKNPDLLLVVSGGQGPGEETTEAAAMREWLIENGVPQTAILAEDKSVSTETNLLFSQELLAQRGLSKETPTVLITNTFHCYRARCYAKRLGFTNIHSLPASMNPGTFLQNYMREVLALVYMWLFRRDI